MTHPLPRILCKGETNKRAKEKKTTTAFVSKLTLGDRCVKSATAENIKVIKQKRFLSKNRSNSKLAKRIIEILKYCTSNS